MTIGRLLSKIYMDNTWIIKAIYNNGQNEIYLNIDERFNKDFSFKDLDIYIIEILPKDNIPEDYFLLPDYQYLSNFETLINKEIIILHFSKEYNATINQFNKNEFSLLGINETISEGSPILLKESNKVIGIYKRNNINNCADFIEPIVDYLKNYSEKHIGNPIDNMEIIMFATFETLDQMIVESIATMSNELFSKVLDRFYDKHSELKNKNCVFIHEGKVLNPNLTMKQNNCKSLDIKITVAYE